MTWNDMPSSWYDDYERGRPSYPREAIQHVGLPSSASVLDLGAGTGKLTRMLASTFDRVIAVEPDDEMRRRLTELCPQSEVLQGAGDDIPVDDASVDAVYAAQSFHWFATERALNEIARVLRVGGVLVLIWNVPAGEIEPPIRGAERLLERVWPEAFHLPLDLGKYAAGDWRVAFPHPCFQELDEARYPNPQTIDPEGLIAFMGSMGWIAALPVRDREGLVAGLRSELTASSYILPWETHVHWTRRSTAG